MQGSSICNYRLGFPPQTVRYLWHLVCVPEWALWVTARKVPHVPFPISQLPGLGPRQGPVALGVTAAMRPACALQMVDSLLQARQAQLHSYLALVSTKGYLLTQHDFNASTTRLCLQQSPQAICRPS